MKEIRKATQSNSTTKGTLKLNEAATVARVRALVAATPTPPDPEVVEKPARRKFTAEYKLQILHEAESCAPGELGALLRREGLYSSHLTDWRRQRAQGELEALTPKQRGRKPQKPNPLARRVAELERDNERLQQRLQQAEAIIEVQKKISGLLGIPLSRPDKGGNS